MSKSSSSAGGGVGCLGFFVIVALIVGVWSWSQGAEPRAAAEGAMILSAKITGGLCCVVAAIIAAVVGIVAVKS